MVCKHVRGWNDPHLLLGPLCETCRQRILDKDPALLDDIEKWHDAKQALLNRAYEATRVKVSSKPSKYSPMTEERLALWWNKLLPVYRSVFQLLLEHPEGIKTPALTDLLKCPPLRLRMVFTAIARSLRAAGIRPRSVMVSEERWRDGVRNSTYTLTGAAKRMLPVAIQMTSSIDSPSE